ncbi:MAG: ATP-binding protein [Panacagrimonas sp.]
MKRSFESVLIANRGEIACRIIRTCRRLGLQTIAVYSDADRNARHVREADTALRIGPAEAANSYLRVDGLMDAALKSRAGAIHPGYGFLSEKTQLVRACTEHGIAWVGPRAEVIEQMGSKIESKHLAIQAGVQPVPGYHGEDQAPARLAEEARRIGFPVLIKASAGGGGKGMRRVDEAAGFTAALELAKQESLRAFGDDRVLIEKLITRPRHLEVQLAGDQHGGLIHLFERECSVQRNYQKVIEEAPAAFLSPLARQRLFDAALVLGRAIRYDSLGTVEFVLDENSDQPYFLEMNTRLQVEHPVTEQITGLDLVELQLRIAAGEPLPLEQSQVQARGWAIEARINCEDPAHNYRPQLGVVGAYREPAIEGVRVESGIREGSEVGPYYDSMVAKIIGSGAGRATALRRLDQGLAQFEAVGVGTNQRFLRELLARPAFSEKVLTTRFLSEQFAEGWRLPADLDRLALAALAFAALDDAGRDSASLPWARRSGFRTMARAGRVTWAAFEVRVDEAEAVAVRLRPDGAQWQVQVGEQALRLKLARVASDRIRIIDCDGVGQAAEFALETDPRAGTLRVSHQGLRWNARVRSQLAALADVGKGASASAGEIRAGIPGVVTAVHVSEGQAVAAGDVVVVMEAMKLIFHLQAGIDGIVAALGCKPGQPVAVNELLVSIAPTAAST